MKFLSSLSVPFALAMLCVGCSSTKTPQLPSTTNMSEQKEAPIQPVEAPLVAVPAELELHTIYFDFDKYDIRPDQMAAVDSMAQSLLAHPEIKIEIQGNADDRGSTEYNLALGTKRGHALKRYLEAKGIPAANISVVSFGKEHPAEQGTGESVWSKNRRDDVVVQKSPSAE